VPSPSYNWTGFYVGLNAGLGGGVARPAYDLSAPSQFGGYPGFSNTDRQTHQFGGAFAGAQAGYNYQFRNNVVLGVESDFQWSNIGVSRRNDSAIVFDTTSAFPISALTATEMRITQNWFGTTRLRLGYPFADRLLAYVTGGVAYSQFTASNWGTGSELSPFPGVYSHISGATTSTRFGWVAGAGFEYALNSRLSLKSEYLYSEYAGITAPYLDTELSTPPVTSGTFSTGTLGIHLVRAGLNYKLGETAPAVDASQSVITPNWSPSWGGFYAGVNGGYGAGTAKPSLSQRTDHEVGAFPFFAFSEIDTSGVSQTLRSGGFLAGGQLGYNRQLPNRFVAGVETDLQWSGVRATSQSNISGVYNSPSTNTFVSNSNLTVGQNWFGTTRLRLGYQPFDRLLAYATGGVAYSGFTANNSGASNDTANGVGTTSGSRGATRLGWAVGAGAEYAIAEHLSFKTEYLYTQYQGFSVPYQHAFTAPFFFTDATQGSLSTGVLGIHLVRAGLNWKLGEAGH